MEPDRDLQNIVTNFLTEAELEEIQVLGEGFINDTYLVKTRATNTPNYLLQRKNRAIFKDVPAMMQNILSVSNHLKQKIIASGGDPLRESITVIPTANGKPYHIDEKNDFWTLCIYIKDHVTYEKADSPELAYAGGKGVGKFQAMLVDLTKPLLDTLPGFHNIRYRFEQWDDTLDNDISDRKKEVSEEISWIEERRNEMLEYWELVEEGQIPLRVAHNDAKISNILFDKDRKPLCMIDLDTVLNSTVLNDFGDAIRSYANTGLEDDENLGRVSMDMDRFKAFAKGYLEEMLSFLSDTELEYLAFSARYITFEQMLRFLMDYIDGDTYYKIKSPKHNLIRARAQYKLLRSMEEQYEQMQAVIEDYRLVI